MGEAVETFDEWAQRPDTPEPGAGARRRFVTGAVVTMVASVAATVAGPVVLIFRPHAADPLAEPSPPPSRSEAACTAHAVELQGIAQGDPQFSVTDMDPTGRFMVGNYRTPGARGFLVPIRWENGVPEAIPVTGSDVFAAAVNSSGEVAGELTLPEGGRSAWVYAEGMVTTLPPPVGYSSAVAIGINGRGEVLGHAFEDPAGGNPLVGSGGGSPVVWSPDRSQAPRVLEPPGAFAYDISDDGTVVGGWSEDPDAPVLPDGLGRVNLPGTAPELPYAWGPDGIGRLLPLPAGVDTATPVQVRGEWAVGDARLNRATTVGESAAAIHAVRWNLRTDTVSIVGGEPLYGARAVNARGDAVITSRLDYRTYLVRDGHSYELSPPSGVPGEELLRVVAMSDDATVIVGTAVLTSHRGVLWRC